MSHGDDQVSRHRMRPGSTPTVSRRELARVLRNLRLHKGYSLETVHTEIGLSPGFLSRVERGLRGLRDDKVLALTTLYGAAPEVTERTRQLASLARRPSWWDHLDLPKAIRDYIGFEQAATAISIFGSIIPGLLQTRAYAEATINATDWQRDEQARSAVIDQRLRRQEVLVRPDPPWINIILDEAALSRQVGGIAVLREQLRAIVEASRRPRTTVRMIRFDAGAHPGMDSRFVLISTRESFEVDFVHVEGLSGYRNYQQGSDLTHFTQAWDALQAVALPPDETMITLARVAASE